MKQFKLSALSLACIVLFSAMTCSKSQQTTTYQTIATAETVAYNANLAFLDSVVSGRTPTNSVAQVEAAFNDTQMSLRLAATVSSLGTNAPVPPAAQAKVTAFTNLVNSVKK